MSNISVVKHLDDVLDFLENKFVIIDRVVFELYHFPLSTTTIVVDAGEPLKSAEKFIEVSELLISKGIRRNSHIVAVGGGTVSDFTGFIAATILRGVKWSVVPTTLLCMVDAAIGGKTGINSKYGKNLIGAFHHPEHIFYDYNFLVTLTEQELHSGVGEVIKYAFLSEEIERQILMDGVDQRAIQLCMNFKESIVKQDPYEQGIRKILNLGHTWGHAIEKNNRLPHGIAILMGLQKLFNMVQDGESLDRLKVLLKQVGIELPMISLQQEHLDYLFCDKKRIDNKISFILANNSTVQFSRTELEHMLDFI